VVHYDPRDIAHLSRYVSEKVLAPHPKDDEENFVATILELSQRWHDAVLMPVSDETLLVASRHKELLGRHFRVACPDYATVVQVIDKRKTYAIAKAADIPVPQTYLPVSAAEAKEFSQMVGFPCLLKPAQSHLFFEHFRSKMFVADNPSELIDYYLQASDAGLDMMIQEIIPGSDREVVNYNSYTISGTPLAEFMADHVRNAPPCFGSPRVACSKWLPELLEPGRQLMESISFSGFACVEFKRDSRDGLFKLMEVNGRHNLSTLLAVRCGINFPWLEYRHLAYGTVPQQQSYETNIYWIDMTRDIAYSIRHLFNERHTLAEYLQPYQGPKIWAIFDWFDLFPFWKRLSFLTGSFLSNTANKAYNKSRTFLADICGFL
jgi:D-aspartate ligase